MKGNRVCPFKLANSSVSDYENERDCEYEYCMWYEAGEKRCKVMSL